MYIGQPRSDNVIRPVPFELGCFAPHIGNASHQTQLCIAHSVIAFIFYFLSVTIHTLKSIILHV